MLLKREAQRVRQSRPARVDRGCYMGGDGGSQGEEYIVGWYLVVVFSFLEGLGRWGKVSK